MDFSIIPVPCATAGSPWHLGQAQPLPATARLLRPPPPAQQTLSQQEEGAPAAATARTLLLPLCPCPPTGHVSWPRSGGSRAATALPPLRRVSPHPSGTSLGTRSKAAGDSAGDPAGGRLGHAPCTPSAQCHLQAGRVRAQQGCPPKRGLVAGPRSLPRHRRCGRCWQSRGLDSAPPPEHRPGAGSLSPGRLRGAPLPCTLRQPQLCCRSLLRDIFSPWGRNQEGGASSLLLQPSLPPQGFYPGRCWSWNSPGPGRAGVAGGCPGALPAGMGWQDCPAPARTPLPYLWGTGRRARGGGVRVSPGCGERIFSSVPN